MTGDGQRRLAGIGLLALRPARLWTRPHVRYGNTATQQRWSVEDGYGTPLQRYSIRYAFTNTGLVDYVETRAATAATNGCDRFTRLNHPVATVRSNAANGSVY